MKNNSKTDNFWVRVNMIILKTIYLYVHYTAVAVLSSQSSHRSLFSLSPRFFFYFAWSLTLSPYALNSIFYLQKHEKENVARNSKIRIDNDDVDDIAAMNMHTCKRNKHTDTLTQHIVLV